MQYFLKLDICQNEMFHFEASGFIFKLSHFEASGFLLSLAAGKFTFSGVYIFSFTPLSQLLVTFLVTVTTSLRITKPSFFSSSLTYGSHGFSGLQNSKGCKFGVKLFFFSFKKLDICVSKLYFEESKAGLKTKF